MGLLWASTFSISTQTVEVTSARRINITIQYGVLDNLPPHLSLATDPHRLGHRYGEVYPSIIGRYLPILGLDPFVILKLGQGSIDPENILWIISVPGSYVHHTTSDGPAGSLHYDCGSGLIPPLIREAHPHSITVNPPAVGALLFISRITEYCGSNILVPPTRRRSRFTSQLDIG